MADEGEVHVASESGERGKMDSFGAGGALCRGVALFHF